VSHTLRVLGDVVKTLEGRFVNLRVAEKEDLQVFTDWMNDLEFLGEYDPVIQQSKAEIEKRLDSNQQEDREFIIEKKDGTKVGFITHFTVGKQLEIGFALTPTERKKGYCTEAVNIMVDYLFLTKNHVRIQAATNVENISCQRVLEKVGFQNEGRLRKSYFVRGDWKDLFMYSILREEWKRPRILLEKERK
jgi:ribosomal-protein-alanine N-acetyltransferase